MTDQTAGEIIANAQRLLDDAGYLAVDDRCESAIALAVLGLQEIGKLILLRWYPEDDEPKSRVSRHIRKQAAAASILLAHEAVKQYEG